MKHITSKENPLLKSLLQLARSSRTRKEEGMIVLDGVHLVQTYLDRYGPQGVELMVKDSAVEHPEISPLLERAHAVSVGGALFDAASPVRTPVGILAIVPRPEVAPVPDGFQVLLDGVQDPGNLGAILRTAIAAGASQAHLSRTCADPWSPKALRGGMGAQLLLPMRVHDDLAAAAPALGRKLVACSADATTSLFDAELPDPVGFVIGGEGIGISTELRARVDRSVRIPMSTGTESLNAAVAAAVCFYEWLRRKGNGRR
jgi:RNA methyltransferase, TrmH family